MSRRLPHAVIALSGLLLLFSWGLNASTLPSRFSDEEFWKFISDSSEPGGTFASENFVSNERSFQHVTPDLKKRLPPGGVYLGVGPEQNFTYIAALRPQIAFIVDIRRGNMMEHLMYKALFELATSRADFLSRLFSRRLPAGIGDASSLESVLAAIRSIPADPAFYDENLSAIRNSLLRTHGFMLSDSDQLSLDHIYLEFFTYGPDITYNGPPVPSKLIPNYEELLLDKGADGRNEGFLASDENFRFVQNLQKKNLIIPLVGNFAGSKALRAIGDYLRSHDAAISAFYTSNVEQYLFMNPTDWGNFYRNVASIPSEPASVFIRAVIQRPAGEFTVQPLLREGYRLETVLHSVPELVTKFSEAGIRDYGDVLRTGNLTTPDSSAIEVDLSPLNPNAGVLVWPDLRPPEKLTARSVSSSQIELKWAKVRQEDVTGVLISRLTDGAWAKLAHLKYSEVCDSDPCSFRDTNVKADTRYCYYIQSADDYSNLGPLTAPVDEDFGDPSITVCATASSSPKN
jgi:hypothetical protein